MIQRSITAVVAGLLATSGMAMGQFQVDHSGANDANPRIGSGGRNITSEQPKPWMLSNDIVYGNVTGGKEFRGRINTFDAAEFRGNLSSRLSDRFIRDSSGVSTRGVTSYNANTTTTYYGDSRAVAPPANFTQIPGGGGYQPPAQSNWRTIDPRQQPSSMAPNYVYRPNQYGSGGPIDMQFVPGAIAVPGDISARELRPLELSDYTQLNRNTLNQLTPQQLQKLRGELLSPQDSDLSTPVNGAKPTGDQIKSDGFRDAINDTVQNKALVSTLDSGNTPEPGTRYRLATAAEQSSTYAQLLQRRAQQENLRPGEANEIAAQQFNEQMRLAKEAKEKEGKTDQPTPRPDGNTKPDTGPRTETPDATPVTPLKVNTLAGDQKSGLNDLLRSAETQLQQGKFASAIESYEAAEKVAPNNALIKLGRAHAELGGGYYRRAEVTIRQALTSDKNLLAGQYNLRGFLGDDRLQAIEGELKDLIQRNDKDVGPLVLQAYLYYNTANERRAAALLELADKRAGGQDPFVSLLKKNWNLPAAEGSLNK